MQTEQHNGLLSQLIPWRRITSTHVYMVITVMTQVTLQLVYV